MKKMTVIAAFMGLAFVFGSAEESKAICLIDCGTEVDIEMKGAGRDLRENSDNVSGAKAEGIGNVAVQGLDLKGDGSVIAGNTLNSGNRVSVGINKGDMSISSGNNIIGTMNDNSIDNSITRGSNNK